MSKIVCEKKEMPNNIVFNNNRLNYAHVYHEIAELNPGEWVECSGLETHAEFSKLQQAVYASVKRSGYLKRKLIEQGCTIRTNKNINQDGSLSLWVTKYKVAPIN